MVAVVFFDMFIESAQLGGILIMITGAAVGGVFRLSGAAGLARGRTLHVYDGYPGAVGIALHNLPEGIAIGAALVETSAWRSLALLMLVHDVPEGIAVPAAAHGRPAGLPRVFLAFLTAIPTAAGAVIGTAVGSTWKDRRCIAFAGGAMFPPLRELIPAAGEKRSPRCLACASAFC